MRTQFFKVAAALCASVFLAPAFAANDVQVVYQENLQGLQFISAMPSTVQKPGAGQLRSLRFDALGKRFDVTLEPNHTLLGPEQRSALDGRLGIYRGEIAGMPGSWARLVIENDMPRGILWNGQEMLAIEVVADAETGTEAPVIFRLEDLQVTPGMLSCSDVSFARNGGELAKAVLAETATVSQGPGAVSQLNMAVIGDFEFTSAKGSGASTALITRINNVDGIFSAQLGVQINANRVDAFASSNDPFSNTTVSGDLLVELSDYRTLTPAQNANGLSHLFTGRDLDTSTVGVAYTGALCDIRFGAGLTQGTHSDTMDSLIAAHEIGHNFNAPHDGVSGPCAAEPQTFLMAPQLNGSNQFSGCSITQMQSHMNGKSCITPLPSTDVALVIGSQPSTALLGDPTTFTLEANSVGTQTATGVNVNVSIPPNVTLSSATASSGTCTSGAGNVNCSLGSIASGSGVTISVTFVATSTGNLDFVGTVSADTDANSNNNQVTVRVTVGPAVDLAVTAAATIQIALNQNTTVRPNVENRASMAATNVTVTVTPDAGIRFDSASWSPGTCTITNNVLSCQASSLAAGANDLMQIQLTGVTEGNRAYSVSITSAETDREPSNNNANGQVTVGNGGGSGGNDSGGGSFEWLSLLLMLVCLPRAIGRRLARKLVPRDLAGNGFYSDLSRTN